MLKNPDADPAPLLCDRALRRQIDRCIGRAVLDPEYARRLLMEPTSVLEDNNCPPQDYLSLQSITAASLGEFAEQVSAFFWRRFSPAINAEPSQVAQPRGLRSARSRSIAS